MLPETLSTTIRAIGEATPGLELVIVFGSLARGNALPESDLDVAVLGTADLFELAGRLSVAIGREVDVVDLEKAPLPLLDAIVSEGIVAFERTRGTEGRFRARTLSILETDRPWYERMQTAWLRKVAAEGILGRS